MSAGWHRARRCARPHARRTHTVGAESTVEAPLCLGLGWRARDRYPQASMPGLSRRQTQTLGSHRLAPTAHGRRVTHQMPVFPNPQEVGSTAQRLSAGVFRPLPADKPGCLLPVGCPREALQLSGSLPRPAPRR